MLALAAESIRIRSSIPASSALARSVPARICCRSMSPSAKTRRTSIGIDRPWPNSIAVARSTWETWPATCGSLIRGAAGQFTDHVEGAGLAGLAVADRLNAVVPGTPFEHALQMWCGA
jgi:hypothetical protein